MSFQRQFAVENAFNLDFLRTGKRYAKYQKEVEKEEKKSKKYKTICLQAKCIKTHGAAHGQPDAWTDMNNISLAFLLCLAMGKAKLGMARAAAVAAGSEKTKTVAKTCHIKCTDSGNRKSMGLECFYCCRNSAGIRFEVDACMWLPTLLFSPASPFLVFSFLRGWGTCLCNCT